MRVLRESMLWVRSLAAAPGLMLMLLLPCARAQTLARPGWAGSGMTVERWWPHAVFCEITPESLAGAGGEGPVLRKLRLRLDDLETVGVDGVLLRGLEGADRGGAGVVPIDPRYGTLEDFDALVSDAVRHGVRVLVELRPGAQGAPLINDARFWLNRGVTGLALGAEPQPGDVAAVRSVLHGYVGERVLIATGPAAGASARPDLLPVALPAVTQGAAAMRSAIEGARAMLTAKAPVPLLRAGGAVGESASARVLATALLGSGGAVLVRADDLDLAHAAASLNGNTVFSWYRQWSGLHRGNALMRSGDDTLLDHDADGALVWVRQMRGMTPVVAVCNVTDRPVRFSLTGDLAKLKLRGSFLRTLARSDGGMGAMPLREVVLPPYAVFVGELGR